MYFHKFTDKQRAEMELEAHIYNYDYEIEILKSLQQFSYSGKVFNARYGTQLDKYLIGEFGSEIYPQWGLEKEDKEIGNVYSKMIGGQGTYGKGYQLNIYYSGKRYNYYEKKLEKSVDYISFYNVQSDEEVKSNVSDMIIHRIEMVNRMEDNLKKLDTLISERNRIADEVMRFNDSVTFPLGDLLKIK